MMKKIVNFYDRYHNKNDFYSGVISKNNFTYFYITKLLQKDCISRAKSILDVGCGVGTISIYLAHHGYRVYGIDISNRAISICNHAKRSLALKNIEFKKQDVYSIRSNKVFDVILLIEVLEHVPNDNSFLKKLHSLLKDDGCLLLTTPTPENTMFKLGLYNKFDREVGHLRRYSKKELEKLLHENGFKIEYFSQTESLLRSLLFVTRLGFLIKFIRGPFIPIFHKLDELVGIFLGFTDNQVIARKTKKS